MKSFTQTQYFGYFGFAFVAMAGLSYINYLPSVVSALAGVIGFSEVEAGHIVSANGYGGLVGTTGAIFLVRKIHWKPWIIGLLASLALVDGGTLWIKSYEWMIGWRFLSGTLGGLSVGIAFSVLARMQNPDKAFGALLFIQFGMGSLIVLIVPGLENLIHSYAVFFVMSAIVVLALLIVSVLPSLPLTNPEDKQPASYSSSTWDLILVLLTIVLYQSAASAIWAYAGQIGLNAQFTYDRVSFFIAVTGFLGLLGALFPIVTGRKFGRLVWIAAGAGLSIAASYLLTIDSLTLTVYASAMALLFFAWPAVQSYLLAVTAELDSSGRLSTVAAVVSSIGLATGPLAAATLLEDGNYFNMLAFCAVTFLISFLLVLKPVMTQDRSGSKSLAPRDRPALTNQSNF